MFDFKNVFYMVSSITKIPQSKILLVFFSNNSFNVCYTIGIIRVQVGVYYEIVYESSGFNRLNDLGVASVFNLSNHLSFTDYFMINTTCTLIIPILSMYSSIFFSHNSQINRHIAVDLWSLRNFLMVLLHIS